MVHEELAPDAVRFWTASPRIEPEVSAFRALRGREPDADETTALLWGEVELDLGDEPTRRLHRLRGEPGLAGLADSVARRGVRRALIATHDGELRDGNRRLAVARRLGLARIPVWRIGPDADEEDLRAICAEAHLDDSPAIPWPEHARASIVAARRAERPDGPEGRQAVADELRLEPGEVEVYERLAAFVEDWVDHHAGVKRGDPGVSRLHATEYVQYLCELRAGGGTARLADQLDLMVEWSAASFVR
jgi:hypothetical protein